jgi:hypothetical protein
VQELVATEADCERRAATRNKYLQSLKNFGNASESSSSILAVKEVVQCYKEQFLD